MQGINKAVEILETQQAQVSIDRLIGVRAFSLDRVLEMEPAFLEVFC
jgi:G3E family GTPase